ncbi:transposase, partial [Azospirillum griseum]|uniref:transposase n=1 Tax=Azospirillum griseum TaxID=2496639 RepID=UPI003CCC62EE
MEHRTCVLRLTVPSIHFCRSHQTTLTFAAWLGLTPKAHSSGGKERQVGISKVSLRGVTPCGFGTFSRCFARWRDSADANV